MQNADSVEDESVGQQYLETHNNWPAQMWIQTSYNTIRWSSITMLMVQNTLINQKHLEEIMQVSVMIWDEDNEIFWPKKPHASWVKNTTTAQLGCHLIGDAPAINYRTRKSQNDSRNSFLVICLE